MNIRLFWVRSGLLCMGLLLSIQPVAQAADAADADVIDWKLAQKRMKSLSKLGYHPFLMPLIMENRDFIGLTKEQTQEFIKWRNKNRVPLLASMNRVIKLRTDFQRISLSPLTSDEVLLTKQEEIFKLHKKILRYQLSCRRTILDQFNDEQWDNFRFVLTENGFELNEQ